MTSSPVTTPGVDERSTTRTTLLPPWRVMLHNDDDHSMDFVVRALLHIVPSLSVEDAAAIMLEAHLTGVALVIVTPRERAEFYCEGLRELGLISTIEPD